MDPDPSNKQKNSKKTLICTVLWLLYDCFCEKLCKCTFWWKEEDPRYGSEDPIRTKISRIRNTGRNRPDKYRKKWVKSLDTYRYTYDGSLDLTLLKKMRKIWDVEICGICRFFLRRVVLAAIVMNSCLSNNAFLWKLIWHALVQGSDANSDLDLGIIAKA